MTTRRYGQWAGNPQGTPEDTTRCVEEVSDGNYRFHQCTRKRGHGLGGLYCKQHDPAAVAARCAKQEDAWRRKQQMELVEVIARGLRLATIEQLEAELKQRKGVTQ